MGIITFVTSNQEFHNLCRLNEIPQILGIHRKEYTGVHRLYLFRYMSFQVVFIRRRTEQCKRNKVRTNIVLHI